MIFMSMMTGYKLLTSTEFQFLLTLDCAIRVVIRLRKLKVRTVVHLRNMCGAPPKRHFGKLIQ